MNVRVAVEKALNHMGVEYEQVKSRTRKQEIVDAIALTAFILIEDFNLSHEHVAAHLHRTRSMMYHYIKTVSAEMYRPVFAENYETMRSVMRRYINTKPKDVLTRGEVYEELNKFKNFKSAKEYFKP